MDDRKVTNFLLAIPAVFVIGVILFMLKSVLLPLIVAVFLSYLFKPLVLFLKKKRVPMAISLLIVVALIAGVFIGIGSIVYASVDAFIEQAPKYQGKLNEIIDSATLSLERISSRYGIGVDQFDWRKAFELSSLTGFLAGSVGTTVNAVGNFLLVMLFMFFILASSGNLRTKLRNSFSLENSKKIADITTRIDEQVRQYLLTKTLISLMSGTITVIILSIIGVDFAFFWGFMAFALNFIPNVGSIISQLFPALMALLQFGSFLQALLVFGLLVGSDMILGNIVEPRMMAFSLNLSPLVILVALIFWGWLWGITGMILAVPMTAIFKIVCENVDELNFVARLMSGNMKAAEAKPSG